MKPVVAIIKPFKLDDAASAASRLAPCGRRPPHRPHARPLAKLEENAGSLRSESMHFQLGGHAQ